MRITTIYESKKSDESYSVHLEVAEDEIKDAVAETIEEMFGLAKQAVKKQIGENKRGGNPEVKNPDLPATKKQKSLIIKLARKKGKFIENLNSLTMGEASKIIEELMNLPDKEEPDVLP